MSGTLGKLIGVSLGPGDPALITRQAWGVLQRPCHWAYPVRSATSGSYALGIAERAGLQPSAGTSTLIFPMTHDLEKLSRYWLKAAHTLLPLLEAGQDVAFLVEGDASTYSTFGHLARTVVALDPRIEIEILPGVPSFHAAAAHLGLPLAEVDDAVAILPAAYGIGTLERLLDDFDTLVLLKVKPLLDDIIALLKRRGLLSHARFVERAGSVEERIVTDLTELKGHKVNYLSLILVKNPERPRGELVRGCRRKSTANEPVSS